MKTGFAAVLRDWRGRLLALPGSESVPAKVRLLEKTPKNALRVGFLRRIFPDAKFIFLYREPRSNIASLIDGWQAPGRFVSYRLQQRVWKFLLPPQWEKMGDWSIPAIAAEQWRCANEAIADATTQMDQSMWQLVDYDQLIADPAGELLRLCEFAGINYSELMTRLSSGKMPLSRSILSPPDPEKWRKHEQPLIELSRTIEGTAARVDSLRRSGSTSI